MVGNDQSGKAGAVGPSRRDTLEFSHARQDMKSPFPGMDTFIEARGLWTDFHDNLIVELQRILNLQLPSRYEALLGERTYIDIVDPVEGSRTGRLSRTRIDVQTDLSSTPVRARHAGTATSVVMHPELKVENESLVEIRDTDDGDRVITCIKFSRQRTRPGSPGWGSTGANGN
jgi:hypothetical protein